MPRFPARAAFGLCASLAALACGAKTDAVTSDAGTASPATDANDRPLAFVALAKQEKIAKVDLLFMIDNSSSMADKQAILALAVPDLVARLVDPVCVDSTTHQRVGMRMADGSCAQGELDFEPVKDIHIGIISSSLGGHGSYGVCDQPDSRKMFAHNDDKGHLLTRGSMDAPITLLGGKPFLNWNPMGGYTSVAEIASPFAQMVTGVGQHGCGYEASLESIYRFLIDPDPYESLTVFKSPENALGLAQLNGTDTVLLGQRADFLRPDSLVAVVMMTDENDCSIIDGGHNFYTLIPPAGSPAKSVLSHGTSACKENPNDVCCFSCLEHTTPNDPPPDGCAAPGGDPECAAGQWLRSEDPENLRCFNQKARYGLDALYPVKRYIDGFTSMQVVDRRGESVRNPLYDDLRCANGMGCAFPRDKRNVFLTGIVGVPWQEIANDPADLTKGYKTARQISDGNIWQRIVGNPQPSDKSRPVLPTDPHMVESVLPRAGLPGPDSDANADPVHGHEWDTSKDSPINRDLQYACTFPLPAGSEKTCADSTDCDCANPVGGMVADTKNPLCQGAGGYTTTQIRGKAYPGIRELQVLQGLNDQAIVASICPANVSDMARDDFGYRPAISALIGQARSALRGRCFPRQLSVDPSTKQVPCTVIEVFNPTPGSDCNCESDPGRTKAASEHLTAEMLQRGSCRCEMHQLSDATDNGGASICQTQVTPPSTVAAGWCYVDPAQEGVNACALVHSCPATDQRIIRYVNTISEPRAGSTNYIVCDPGTPIASGPPVCP